MDENIGNQNQGGSSATRKRRKWTMPNPLTRSQTVIPLWKFNYLWTIKTFSEITDDVENVCCPEVSPPYSKDKWCLKLKPRSVDEGTGTEYIGLHLFLRSTENSQKREIRAKYRINVLDAEGETKFHGNCSRPDGRVFIAGGDGHGYSLLAPREFLLNPANNMLGREDTLQVLFEIFEFRNVEHKLLPSFDTNIYSASDLKRSRTMEHDFSQSRESEDAGYDITIEANDGVHFGAHSLILKTRSKVFHAMLSHDTSEKRKSSIMIPDFDSAVIREMISFLYTDKVAEESFRDMAGDLLLAGDKYDLPRLKHLCEQHLSENIDSENCGYVLTLADMCSCLKLKQRVLDFVVTDPAKTVHLESWDKHVGNRPYLYKETLNAIASHVKKQKQL